MIQISNLSFRYEDRLALDNLSFDIPAGKIYGLLGPNGSGKTTLFRMLSTATDLQEGTVSIAGNDLSKAAREIRKILGVVFQSPSLDPYLTVEENLKQQGALYGLKGVSFRATLKSRLADFNLGERKKDLTRKLSGGLKRRVELAKALLHDPKILILDEPSTGLDPAARKELWDHLRKLKTNGVTILLTTHLMEEAECCDELAILDQGKLVAKGSPEDLKKAVNKSVLVLKTHVSKEKNDRDALAKKIKEQFKLETFLSDDEIHIETDEGASLVARIVEAFPGEIESVTYRKPSLLDVFMHHTGKMFSS